MMRLADMPGGSENVLNRCETEWMKMPSGERRQYRETSDSLLSHKSPMSCSLNGLCCFEEVG